MPHLNASLPLSMGPFMFTLEFPKITTARQSIPVLQHLPCLHSYKYEDVIELFTHPRRSGWKDPEADMLESNRYGLSDDKHLCGKLSMEFLDRTKSKNFCEKYDCHWVDGALNASEVVVRTYLITTKTLDRLSVSKTYVSIIGLRR